MKAKIIPRDTPTFHYFNANPAQTLTGDCVIRALSLALNKPWATVLRELTEYAVRYSTMPNAKDCYPRYLADQGWVKQKQPRLPDGRKLRGYEFAPLCPVTAIAHIGTHHIVCIRDRRIWDLFDSGSRCVGNFWIKAEAAPAAAGSASMTAMRFMSR